MNHRCMGCSLCVISEGNNQSDLIFSEDSKNQLGQALSIDIDPTVNLVVDCQLSQPFHLNPAYYIDQVCSFHSHQNQLDPSL